MCLQYFNLTLHTPTLELSGLAERHTLFESLQTHKEYEYEYHEV